MTDTCIDFICAMSTGFAAWFFGGLDGLMTFLLALIVIDYVSGTLVAFKLGEISSSRGFWGVTKKCMMITFIGMGHLVDTMLPTDGALFRSLVCFFYISTEGSSIFENADKLGVPFPEALRKHFLSMKDTHNQLEKPTKANDKTKRKYEKYSSRKS